MSDLNALDLALIGTVGAIVGALYLRLTSLLDKTAERLEDVAVSLSNHGARLDSLERTQ